MIEIEFEEPDVLKCNCCDNDVKRLTRFIYKDEDAYGIYYIEFTNGHSEKKVKGIISLGNWFEGSLPSDRKAFPFILKSDEESYLTTLVNKVDSPWNEIEILGNILDRKKALEDELKSEVFHIINHITTEDNEVIEYLG